MVICFLSLHFIFFFATHVMFSSRPSPRVSILGGAIVAIVRIRTNPDPDDFYVYYIFRRRHLSSVRRKAK